MRGIEAGADDFLSKPVDDRELLARIRTALALKRAIDETVDELRSTSAHLERYGTRDARRGRARGRLAPARPEPPRRGGGLRQPPPPEAAEERIGALGGVPSEADARPLVAVFDGPDVRARATRGRRGGTRDPGRHRARATLLRAERERRDQRGSRGGRLDAGDDRGRSRAGYSERRASRSIGRRRSSRAATGGGVLVADDAAAAVSDRFRLAPVGDGAYRVLAATAGAEDDDGALLRHPTAASRTILVTDIVGSTQTVEHLGDRAWGEVVAEHERVTRARSCSSAARSSTRLGTASSPPSRARRARFAARSRCSTGSPSSA